MFRRTIVTMTLVAAIGVVTSSRVQALEVTVTIENLSPQSGTYLTPVWAGFHNGSFDIFNLGDPASMALERLAEDGMTGPLAAAFFASGHGQIEGTIPGPNGPIAPGDITSATFDLDPNAMSSRYFSFASMVIPSNDAFISNDAAMGMRIFDDQGNFLGANFFVAGGMVLDAGTEVNTELPMDTAFLGQMDPNTGPDENGVVHTHMGFKRPGEGGILDVAQFGNADFIQPGYPIAQIRVTPEPASALLLGVGATLLLRRRMRGAS
jgi:hypothetical protein